MTVAGEVAESSGLDLQRATEPGLNFWNPKTRLHWFPPTSPYLLILSKECHSLMTKQSNIWAYGYHSIQTTTLTKGMWATTSSPLCFLPLVHKTSRLTVDSHLNEVQNHVCKTASKWPRKPYVRILEHCLSPKCLSPDFHRRKGKLLLFKLFIGASIHEAK